MIERTDDDWLGRLAQAGPADDGALAELREVLKRGLGRALRAHPGADDAFLDDVTQDAMLRVLGRLGDFRGDSKFTTWAIAVGVRVAFTELRRARWRDVPLDGLADSVPTPGSASGPGPSSRIERDEVVALMKRLIETELTDRQRFAVRAALEGMPHAEIIARLGLTSNAYYKLGHDARQKLKRGLLAAGITEDDVRELFALAS